jgi:hypothetical protein
MQSNDINSNSDGDSTVQVPVFVLRMPENVETFVDATDQRVLATHFPDPPGSGSSSSSSHISNDWPSSAVLVISSSHFEPSAQPEIHTFPELLCGSPGKARALPAANGWLEEELKSALKRAIWGLGPDHVHYSGGSRSEVEDFLFVVPPSLREMGSSFNTEESFKYVELWMMLFV